MPEPADACLFMVGVAQLVRAPDCGSGGRGFESHHPPHQVNNLGGRGGTGTRARLRI